MKTSKKAVKGGDKGVSPPSFSLDLLSFVSAAIVLNAFALRYKLHLSAVVSLLLIGYSGSLTVTSLTLMQHGNRSSYRNIQYRLAGMLDKGLIVNDGKGNYSLSAKCIGAMREVLVSGERAKILQDIDKRIARSEAYRRRKAGLK